MVTGEGVLQPDGRKMIEPRMDARRRRRCRRLHGEPAAVGERAVHDGDGDQDALRRARLMHVESAPLALREWHEFYVLLGTAAAALVALLFVAVSIGVGYLKAERASATRTYFSPIVIHFSSVLFISLIMLIPEGVPLLIETLLAVNAIIGAVVGLIVFMRVSHSRHEALGVFRPLRLRRNTVACIRSDLCGCRPLGAWLDVVAASSRRRRAGTDARQHPQRLGHDGDVGPPRRRNSRARANPESQSKVIAP